MRRVFLGVGFLGATMAMAAVTGCGSKAPTNRPATVPVTGKVTYKGQPLEGALVTFSAQSPSNTSKGAVATTDASGNFRLTTFDSGDGAVPGNYRVSVTKSAAEAPNAGAPMDSSKPPAAKPQSLVPAKYGNPATSGLTAEVKKDGENKFEFPLTD